MKRDDEVIIAKSILVSCLLFPNENQQDIVIWKREHEDSKSRNWFLVTQTKHKILPPPKKILNKGILSVKTIRDLSSKYPNRRATFMEKFKIWYLLHKW